MMDIILMLSSLPRALDLLEVNCPIALRFLDFSMSGLGGLAVLLLVRKQWRTYHFSMYRKLLKRIQVKKSRPTLISGR